MRKPKAPKGGSAIELWNECVCSRFLLEHEDNVWERVALITEDRQPPGHHYCISFAAFNYFRNIIRGHPTSQKGDELLRLAMNNYMMPLPDYFLEMDNDPNFWLAEHPMGGEHYARMFLRLVADHYEKRPTNSISEMSALHYAMAIAEAWHDWQYFAFRNPDGGSFALAYEAKQRDYRNAELGGRIKAALRAPDLQARDSRIRTLAASLPENLSKSAKANIIKRRAKDLPEMQDLSVERIRRLI